MQHTASHCNTLYHTATHCITLQHTATHCNTLHHTATHCNTLQRTTTRFNTLQHTATHCYTLLHTAAHCNTLHHTAAHCSTLQGSASHCNTLQHMPCVARLFPQTIHMSSHSLHLNECTCGGHSSKCIHISVAYCALKGGEDTYDGLTSRSLSAKEPLIIGFSCGK